MKNGERSGPIDGETSFKFPIEEVLLKGVRPNLRVEDPRGFVSPVLCTSENNIRDDSSRTMNGQGSPVLDIKEV